MKMEELKELDKKIYALQAEYEDLFGNSRLGQLKIQINDLSRKRESMRAERLEKDMKELLSFSWIKGLQFEFSMEVDYDDDQLEYTLFCKDVPEIINRIDSCTPSFPVLAGETNDHDSHVFLRVIGSVGDKEQHFFEIVSKDVDEFKKFIKPLDINILHEPNGIMSVFEAVKTKITE